jgi:hypothetical protein
MSDGEHSENRRAFIRRGAGGAALIAAGAVTGVMLRQRSSRNAQERGPQGQTIPGSGYDLEALAKVDPDLISYRRSNLFETGFQAARGLFLAADGDVLVAGDDGFRRFSAEGEEKAAERIGAPAHALWQDAEGDIWLASDKRVFHFPADGGTVGRWVPPYEGEHGRITSIAVSRGEVFLAVEDRRRGSVWRCPMDFSGAELLFEPNPEAGILPIIAPSPYIDLGITEEGNVLVGNLGQRQVQLFSPKGDLLAVWGRSSFAIDGFCGCCNPVTVAALPDGRVVTGEKGLKRVKIYRTSGDLDTVVAAPSEFTSSALAGEPDPIKLKGLDVAVSADNSVYVLDQTDGTVHVMMPLENG